MISQIMSNPLLDELSAVKTWVEQLPQSSEEMPKMVMEDVIYLIEFHLEIIKPQSEDSVPDPRRALCVLWPRLCSIIEKTVETHPDDLYQPPWW